MPPLWPTIATGPGSSSAMRSSGMVINRCGAARLPRQLGPDTARPASSIACRSRTASSRPLWVAALAEAAGEHGGAARLDLAGFRDGVDRGRARHDHHHVVGRLRQVGERRVAGLAVPDRLVARIDRVDRAREAEAAQRLEHPQRPVAGPVARAHDGDAARIEQRPHALRASGPASTPSSTAVIPGRRDRSGVYPKIGILIAQLIAQVGHGQLGWRARNP